MSTHHLDDCFPVPLQDLCLLAVINDLDKYPVSLLASLPRWFRCRLLNNLPVIDLCLLDHTAVAQGIDIKEVWKTRWPPCSSRGLRSQFLVTEYWLEYSRFELPFGLRDLPGVIKSARELQGLEPKLEVALQTLPRGPRYGSFTEDHRTEYLIMLALALLYNKTYQHTSNDPFVPLSVPKAVARELVSISGSLLLQELTKAYHIPYSDVPTYTKRGDCVCAQKGQKYYKVWEKQGIPLSKCVDRDVEITPKRYQLIRTRADRGELIPLIIKRFNLRASNIHLDIAMLTSLSHGQVFSLLKYLLRGVQILGLYNSHSTMPRNPNQKQVTSVRTIMETCIGNGVECQLGGFFCDLNQINIYDLSPFIYTPPGEIKQPYYNGLSVLQCTWIDTRLILPSLVNLIRQQTSLKYVNFNIFGRGVTDKNYPEAVQLFSSLSSLFQRPHFQVLHLDTHEIDPHLLTLLVHGFITAPCSGSQQLSMSITAFLPDYCSFKLPQPCGQLVETRALSFHIPDCGLQHKRLVFNTSEFHCKSVLFSTLIFDVLLQLPMIRLKELMFKCVVDKRGNYPYIHLAAVHPDLLLSAMSFHFDKGCGSQKFLLTIKEDFKMLFRMVSLKEISIAGHWEGFQEVKQALILGLEEQKAVKSLNKISLDSSVAYCNKEEHVDLWKSLLSLPQLAQMEVVVKGYLCDKMKDNADLIFDSWKQLSLRHRVKSIQIVKPTRVTSAGFDFLSIISETYSITK